MENEIDKSNETYYSKYPYIYILIKISDIFKIISDIVKDKIAFKTQSKAEN